MRKNIEYDFVRDNEMRITPTSSSPPRTEMATQGSGEDRIHAVDAERLQVCKRPPHEWMGEGVRGEDTEEEREGEINDIIRWNN